MVISSGVGEQSRGVGHIEGYRTLTLVTRARAAGILALFCVALFPGSVLASGTLDQSYEDTTGTIAGSTYGFDTVGGAQTFTAGISGTLDTVALHGASVGCSGGTHTVQIRSVTLAGLPVGGPTDTSGVLAEQTNVACVVGFYNITFASPATVVAGQQYAIVWGNQSVYHYYKPGVHTPADVPAAGTARIGTAVPKSWTRTGSFGPM
jgi:hypothetical protein